MPRYREDLNTIYISERMQECLRQIEESTFTTIIAPMGYGKTTAVSWYLEKRRQMGDQVFRVNIYSNNISLFWKSFCGAFHNTELGKQISQFDFPMGETAVGLLAETVLDYLCHREDQFFLFIDDYHLMNDGRVLYMLIKLTDIPVSNLHIIVASRNAILSQSEDMHLGQRRHAIATGDLRLNPTELSIYCRRCGVSMSKKQLAELSEQSEGWFSAVYLNLKSISMGKGLLDGRDDVLDMMDHTLVEGLNSGYVELLQKMCLADEFSLQQAEYITEQTDVADRVRNLSASNAFVRYLPDTQTYRFHHMLQECMQKQFSRLPSEEQAACRTRYGKWHESQRQYTQAINFYDQAGDRRSALRVIGLDGGTQLAAIAPERILSLLDNCTEEELMAELQGLLVLMRRLFSWQQIPRMLKIKDVLLKAVSQSELAEDERNNLLGNCDLIMSFLYYNDITAMSQLHQSACRLMSRPSISIPKNGSFTFGSPSVLMMFHREAGKLDSEINEMNHSMPYYYQVTDGQGMGAEQIMEAEAFFNRRQFVDAHIMLEKARASAAGEQQNYILLCCDFLSLRLALCGQLPYQEEWYERKLEQFKASRDPMLFTVLDGCLAYIHALLGRVDRIPIWLRDGKLAEANLLNPARPMFEMIYNQVLLAQKQYAVVIGRSEGLLKSCQAVPYLLCELHIHIQLAAAYCALNRRKDAEEKLRTAFEIAVPDGILLPFVENGVYLRELLTAMQRKYPQQISAILACADEMENVKRGLSGNNSADLGLTESELAIARLIVQRKTRKEIADTLYLAEHTVKNKLTHIYDKLHISGKPTEKREQLTKMLSNEK